MSDRRGLSGRGAAVGVGLLGAALTLGCGHARSVDKNDDSAKKSEEKGERSAAAESAHEGSQKSAAHKGERPAGASTPVSSRPGGLMAEGGVKEIQQKLKAKGLLSASPSGTLDDDTSRALRRFQKDEGLPETGLPDQETARRLGLDPNDVFQKSESAREPTH